jgi:hypothetical protein
MLIERVMLKVRGEDMKPQKFTTEDSEKKNFRFVKCSVNSAVPSSPKEYPWIIECRKVKGWHKKTNTMRAQRGGGKRLSRNLFIFEAFLSVLCG